MAKLRVLKPCWRGDWRDQDEKTGKLYCRYWRRHVNPTGFTCETCRKRIWPEIERVRAHVLPNMTDKQKQSDLILEMVRLGEMDKAEAVQLGEKYGL